MSLSEREKEREMKRKFSLLFGGSAMVGGDEK
jgi:hypothetical protein